MGFFTDEDDDDEDVSSQKDVDDRFERERRRPGVSFKRRPRFAQQQGQARWYGECGTGFWHQHVCIEVAYACRFLSFRNVCVWRHNKLVWAFYVLVQIVVK